MEAVINLAVVGVIAVAILLAWRTTSKTKAANTAQPTPARAPSNPQPATPAQPQAPAWAEESRYLHSSRWAELLVLKNGLPPLHLVKVDAEYWLAEDTTGLLVNVANRSLAKMGLWTFKIRGLSHNKAASTAGQFSPGSTVSLVREPENEYDENAVAIHATNRPGVVGYVNKGMAPRVAKQLDNGVELVAIAVRGAPAGRINETVKVIATTPALMAHLQGRL